MCSIDSTYSPNNCNLIEDWTLLSFENSNKLLRQQLLKEHDLEQNDIKEKEIIVREIKPTTRRRGQRVVKNDKK
jgi:hypothetical protein